MSIGSESLTTQSVVKLRVDGERLRADENSERLDDVSLMAKIQSRGRLRHFNARSRWLKIVDQVTRGTGILQSNRRKPRAKSDVIL